MTDNATPLPRPWWRYSYVWLLISGPAAVIVAGFVTAWIAVNGADPVVAHDYYKRGLEINKTLAEKALMPAVQGRNHAATPAAGQR
jgi:hypothetical protein